MHKRKLTGAENRGQNISVRRSSMMNLCSKATNITECRREATNIQSRSRLVDRQLNDGIFISKLRCSDTSNAKITKLMNFISRKKSFPTETIKESNDPCSVSVPGSTVDVRTLPLPSPTRKQNIGHNDTTELDRGEVPTEQYKIQNAAFDQQHISKGGQQSSKVNDSEVTLSMQNKIGEEQPMHIPYIPNILHGMKMRDCTLRRMPSTLRANTASTAAVILNNNPYPPTGQSPIISSITHQPVSISSISIQQSQEQQKLEQQQQQNKLMSPLQNITPERDALPQFRQFSHKKQEPPLQLKKMQQQHIKLHEREKVPTAYHDILSEDNFIGIGKYNTTIPDQQDLQQIDKQQQQNSVHQQQMQQRLLTSFRPYVQQMPTQYNHYVHSHIQQQQTPAKVHDSISSGMTSPQDIIINEKKSSQNTNPLHHQILDHRHNCMYPTKPRSSWLLNNQVDLIQSSKNNYNQVAEMTQYEQSKSNKVQPLMMIQQKTMKHIPSQLQHQSYQSCQGINHMDPDISQQPLVHTSMKSFDQQLVQPILEKRQISEHQNQVVQEQQQVQQQNLRQQQPPPRKNKDLEFTPEMLHDQELLLINMKQQGVPENVMRRQFNMLLNEQRKQLLCIEYQKQLPFVNEKDSVNLRELKISKIENEQKPEWMVHLTPPRISYLELERVTCNNNLKKIHEGQQQITFSQIRGNDASQVPSIQQETNAVTQKVKSPSMWKNNQFQQSAYQPWLHQTTNCQQNYLPHPNTFRSSHPCIQMQPYPTEIPIHRHQQNKKKSPLLAENVMHTQLASLRQEYPYSQYFQNIGNRQQDEQQQYHQQHQHWQQQHLPNTVSHFSQMLDRPKNNMANRDEILHTEKETFERCDQMRQCDESYSLLKLREFKEIIRPQKRNNGLQDLNMIREALEELHQSENRRGFEYLANLKRKEVPIKLNGAQDSNEVTNLSIQQSSAEVCQHSTPKRVSFNGLENSRNSNNPASSSTTASMKFTHDISECNQQERNDSLQNYYSLVAERENGSTAPLLLHNQQPYLINSTHKPIHNQTVPQNPMAATQMYQAQSHAVHPTHLQQAQPLPTVGCITLDNPRNPVKIRNLTALPFSFQDKQPQSFQKLQQFYYNRERITNNSCREGGSFPAIEKPEEQATVNMNQPNIDSTLKSTGATSQIMQNKNRSTQYLQIQPLSNGSEFCDQSNIRQPIIIGGFTYFPGRPNYISNASLVMQDT